MRTSISKRSTLSNMQRLTLDVTRQVQVTGAGPGRPDCGQVLTVIRTWVFRCRPAGPGYCDRCSPWQGYFFRMEGDERNARATLLGVCSRDDVRGTVYAPQVICTTSWIFLDHSKKIKIVFALRLVSSRVGPSTQGH